jgi:peptide-methionine (S)-S-oxide reductase
MAAPPQEAVFAGGCFWCLEHDLEILPGVFTAESGYSGGKLANPSYQKVSAGGTGHQESVRVRFDPDRISYAALLKAYWRNIDPLDGGGQFCDRGDSYRPVIFTNGQQQSLQAQASSVAIAKQLGRAKSSLAVQIKPLQQPSATGPATGTTAGPAAGIAASNRCGVRQKPMQLCLGLMTSFSASAWEI